MSPDRKLAPMPYRLVYAGLALLAVAIVALGIVFAPRGTPSPLPGPVEAVFPGDGDAVIRQAQVEVDLAVGYEADLEVDGYPIPSAEVFFDPSTGLLRWGPAPTGVVFTEWSTGRHTVTLRWTRVVDVPETGEYTWEFRVQ